MPYCLPCRLTAPLALLKPRQTLPHALEGHHAPVCRVSGSDIAASEAKRAAKYCTSFFGMRKTPGVGCIQLLGRAVYFFSNIAAPACSSNNWLHLLTHPGRRTACVSCNVSRIRKAVAEKVAGAAAAVGCSIGSKHHEH